MEEGHICDFTDSEISYVSESLKHREIDPLDNSDSLYTFPEEITEPYWGDVRGANKSE